MLVLLDIVRMLLSTGAALLGGALLLRVYLSWVHISRSNPLVQFCSALTDWLVRPLRAVLPVRSRLDWPCLVGALVVALVFGSLMRATESGLGAPWSLLVPEALYLIARWSLYMLLMLVTLYALLSLINPHAPLAPTFELLTRPLLAPLRRFLPPVGGWDLTPMAFMLIVSALLMILDSIRV